MVDSPLDHKCKMNGSICSEAVEKHSEGQFLTPLSTVASYPVLSSKKGAQILKKNPSHGLNITILSGKEIECTRELRSTETRKRSSFSSPTISSFRKIRQKDRQSQPTTTHTKCSTPWSSSSKPQLLHQKTKNKALVFQSKIQKSPNSQPPLVTPWALAGKMRLPTSIRHSRWCL